MQTSVLMTSLRAQALNFLLTLALVAVVTAGLYGIISLTGLTHGSAVYLIPVLIAYALFNKYLMNIYGGGSKG